MFENEMQKDKSSCSSRELQEQRKQKWIQILSLLAYFRH